jgi:hypothetical protein
VRTPPADLPEPALRAALQAGWSLRAATLAYRPVGFGSHHWELTDTAGGRRFVTVDDLRTRRVAAGEPHPGNTIRAGAGWLLIDWDTALVAPPERDLWDLDPGDGSLHAAYTAATGTALRPGLLDLYRLRWDLTEIAVCLARFREPHCATADDEESWELDDSRGPGPADGGTAGTARSGEVVATAHT